MKKININDISLQKLRIPTGWKITYNEFHEIDPDTEIELINPYNNLGIFELFFMQDIFQAEHESSKVIVDIGWYPEGDPSGKYNLEVILWSNSENNQERKLNWEKPLFQKATSSRAELVNLLEEIFIKVPSFIRNKGSEVKFTL